MQRLNRLRETPARTTVACSGRISGVKPPARRRSGLHQMQACTVLGVGCLKDWSMRALLKTEWQGGMTEETAGTDHCIGGTPGTKGVDSTARTRRADKRFRGGVGWGRVGCGSSSWRECARACERVCMRRERASTPKRGMCHATRARDAGFFSLPRRNGRSSFWGRREEPDEELRRRRLYLQVRLDDVAQCAVGRRTRPQQRRPVTRRQEECAES